MSSNIEEEIKKEQIKSIDKTKEEKITEQTKVENKKIKQYIIIFILAIILNSLLSTYNSMYKKQTERALQQQALEKQMLENDKFEKQLKGDDSILAEPDPECKNNDKLTGTKNPFCQNENKGNENQDPFLNSEISDETDPFCENNQCLEKKYIGLTVEQAKAIAKKDGDIIRAVKIDGTPQIITDDIINSRVNATIQKGIITEVSIEYIDVF